MIGLITVFSPHVLQSNVHLGVSPSWHDFVISIPVAMVAYTGIETISNMAEEAIDPPRHVPRSIMYVVLAVFAIYAFLPSVALSALPVHPATAQDVANVVTSTSAPPSTGCRSVIARPTWPAVTRATRWPAWSTTSACPTRSPAAWPSTWRSWPRRS